MTKNPAAMSFLSNIIKIKVQGDTVFYFRTHSKLGTEKLHPSITSKSHCESTPEKEKPNFPLSGTYSHLCHFLRMLSPPTPPFCDSLFQVLGNPHVRLKQNYNSNIYSCPPHALSPVQLEGHIPVWK